MRYAHCIVLLAGFSFVACGQKNPGMNQKDVVNELNKQPEPKEVKIAVAEFPEGYTAPAGIKYQPEIKINEVMHINVQAALNKTRPMKVSELGKMELHRTGVEARPRRRASGSLIRVKENYVLAAGQGLYLLDKNFKFVKQLFKNDVTLGSMFEFRKIITNSYYDPSTGQLRCSYMEKKSNGAMVNCVISLPWETLVASAEPWTSEDITSKLEVDNGVYFHTVITGMEGGAAKVSRFPSRFYTLGLKGDTLCCFNINNLPPNAVADPSKSFSVGEWCNYYIRQGKVHVRIAYSNTLYRIENASTLKALYQLDSGNLHLTTEEEAYGKVISKSDNSYSISGWFDTEHYLFVQLTIGNTTLVYNKDTKELFSLPSSKEKDSDPVLEQNGKTNIPFFPNDVVEGIPVMYLYGKDLKEKYPEYAKANGLNDLSDEELLIVVIR